MLSKIKKNWIKCKPYIKHYIDPRNTLLVLLVLSFLLVFLFSELCSYIGIPLIKDIYWTAGVGLIAYLGGKFIATRIKRHNGMCHLETELSHALGTINDMIVSCQNMIEKQLPILMPHEKLTISLELVQGVGRLDTKNNLLELLCDFRKINQDWDLMVKFGEDYKSDLANPRGVEIRMVGTESIKPILKKCLLTHDLIKETVLLIRYYIKQDRPLLLFGQPYINKEKFSKTIEKDRVQLDKEIQESEENTFPKDEK